MKSNTPIEVSNTQIEEIIKKEETCCDHTKLTSKKKIERAITLNHLAERALSQNINQGNFIKYEKIIRLTTICDKYLREAQKQILEVYK